MTDSSRGFTKPPPSGQFSTVGASDHVVSWIASTKGVVTSVNCFKGMELEEHQQQLTPLGGQWMKRRGCLSPKQAYRKVTRNTGHAVTSWEDG